jgi:signal transduction histidine kinase
MRERVAGLGGMLNIASDQDKGSSVHICLPRAAV